MDIFHVVVPTVSSCIVLPLEIQRHVLIEEHQSLFVTDY
jgi:hypothetical protein